MTCLVSPAQTHTGILHCCAGLQSLFNVVCARSCKFVQRSCKSLNPLVCAVFKESSFLAYSFAGMNLQCGAKFLKVYTRDDKICAGCSSSESGLL